MPRKTRAEKDAEILAALEADQGKIDAGEVAIEDVEARLSGDDVPVRIVEDAPLVTEVRQEPTSRISEDDMETLKRELANLKRTVSFYEQELNPAQRLNQQLEREVAELREKLAAKPVIPEGPADYGLTDEEKEFDTVRSISEKVTKAHEAKVLREIDSLKATLKQYEAATTQAGIQAKVNEHRSELTKALGGENPDALFAHPKIKDWMENQSEEEMLALRNPVMYSPKFVASVLARFKAEVLKGQAERKPSHGELAVPDRVAPDAVVRSSGSDNSGPAFNQATFQADVNKLIADGKIDQANKLIDKAERAMSA
jgi:hypothetical protein